MKCIDCYYYRSLSGLKIKNDNCCHYVIETGKLRKIPPSECYKHEGTPYLNKKGDYDLYSSGKYQNNTGIQPSLMYKDFEKRGMNDEG